ncbi:MAG: hypothetical protein M1339_08630 [Bacteroidetes bacterium]|nr:hypothetical protein [Bacteroidota bacterium]
MSNNMIVALDIGTTKVCALVVESDQNGKLNVLGIGTSKSGGMSRGVVANIDRTVKSIQEAVRVAESKPGTKIKSAIVGIAGEHIDSFKTNSIITVSNPEHEITESDIDRLIEDAKRVHLSRDREIIHIIPQEFIIDGQTVTHDPIGMAGVRVEASMACRHGARHCGTEHSQMCRESRAESRGARASAARVELFRIDG